MIAGFDGFIEVETAQQLGRHNLHLAIGLNQHLAIAGESFKGFLPKQLRRWTASGSPLGHQVIAPFDQAGAPGGGVALFQPLKFAHHRVEQGAAVIEQVA